MESCEASIPTQAHSRLSILSFKLKIWYSVWSWMVMNNSKIMISLFLPAKSFGKESNSLVIYSYVVCALGTS